MTETTRRRSAGVLILSAVLAIAIGAGMLAFQRDSAAEKQAEADRDSADRAYARCLESWGNELTDALRRSRAVTQKLDDAEARKDELLDQLIELSNQAQASGATSQEDLPPAFIKRYETTLSERVDAQRDFRRLRAQLEDTQNQHPLVAPKVKCSR